MEIYHRTTFEKIKKHMELPRKTSKKRKENMEDIGKTLQTSLELRKNLRNKNLRNPIPLNHHKPYKTAKKSQTKPKTPRFSPCAKSHKGHETSPVALPCCTWAAGESSSVSWRMSCCGFVECGIMLTTAEAAVCRPPNGQDGTRFNMRSGALSPAKGISNKGGGSAKIQGRVR